jgi:hypothetical protein
MKGGFHPHATATAFTPQSLFIIQERRLSTQHAKKLKQSVHSEEGSTGRRGLTKEPTSV